MWIDRKINKRATRLSMCFFFLHARVRAHVCVCVRIVCGCRYVKDRGCHPECTPCFEWANTLCAGSYVFHLQTDSRTNKHHSLPTHVSLDFIPPVSFYLKACLVTSSSLLDLKTSRSVRVSSIISARNTLVSIPEALRAFQCLFFSHEFFCFAHCGSKWLLISSIFSLDGGIVGLVLKIHCSSWELEVILLKHLVMTQAAYQIHITCDSLSWG